MILGPLIFLLLLDSLVARTRHIENCHEPPFFTQLYYLLSRSGLLVRMTCHPSSSIQVGWLRHTRALTGSLDEEVEYAVIPLLVQGPLILWVILWAL